MMLTETIIGSTLLLLLCGNGAASFAGQGQLWAVLVAGSDTWMNYRHQADVCHAYQVLHSHGIPDDRIIVFMKDDLAYNNENPTPGKIINHPQGKDVYRGVPHDYTGEAVTPENFLAALRGDEGRLRGVGSGKVLHSGPKDHVFVYFADHGAPGLIAFPESELSASDLNNTIRTMHERQKYGKMVIYVEACESGSMFKNILPNDINVYATTAANAVESSYACYFDNERDTYLGDVYSVNWLEDSDKEMLSKETLEKQFRIVKRETNTSHVQQFGDLRIGKMHVSEFQGRTQAEDVHVLPLVPKDPVRSRDVPLELARKRIFRATTEEERQRAVAAFAEISKGRRFVRQVMTQLVEELFPEDVQQTVMMKRSLITDFACYNSVRTYFDTRCFKLSKNPYVLDWLHVMVNMCEARTTPKRAQRAMDSICIHPPIRGIV